MKNNVIKTLSRAFALILVFMLVSCGKTPADTAANTDGATGGAASTAEPAEDTNAATDPSAEVTVSETDGGNAYAATDKAPSDDHKKVLVVFFSATGTTKRAAEKIASIEDADVYEIKAENEYTEADLNWHDSGSRTTKEQNDKKARPAIGSAPVSLDGYEKIYVGYPIWWGEEPRIMDTFVESHDFGAASVIPFCTSSSSGIGRSGKNLAENANGGNWLEGRRFGGNVSESELRSWIEGMK